MKNLLGLVPWETSINKYLPGVPCMLSVNKKTKAIGKEQTMLKEIILNFHKKFMKARYNKEINKKNISDHDKNTWLNKER